MQVHIIFKGIVQGVGFRERTRRMARSLNVFGWIRNNPDGTVEAIFKGSPESVEKLIQYCENGISDAIVTEKIMEYQEEGNFEDFKILK